MRHERCLTVRRYTTTCELDLPASASSHHPRFAMGPEPEAPEMDAIAMLVSEHEIDAIAACCENLVSGRLIVEMKVSHSSR